jgi:hypothetical protein
MTRRESQILWAITRDASAMRRCLARGSVECAVRLARDNAHRVHSLPPDLVAREALRIQQAMMEARNRNRNSR